jgi:hypothetical protein
MGGRYYWGDILMELRRVLIRSEDELQKKYGAQKPGMEAGLWIEQMTTGAAASGNPSNPGAIGVPNPPMPGETGGAPPVPGGAPGQNSTVRIVCRAVDLSGIDSAANNEIVYAVVRELKASPVFDPKTVEPSAQISPVDANGTFTFSIGVTPQNPLKL